MIGFMGRKRAELICGWIIRGGCGGGGDDGGYGGEKILGYGEMKGIQGGVFRLR